MRVYEIAEMLRVRVWDVKEAIRSTFGQDDSLGHTSRVPGHQVQAITRAVWPMMDDVLSELEDTQKRVRVLEQRAAVANQAIQILLASVRP